MNDIYSFDPRAVALEIVPILAKHNIRIDCLPAVWESVVALTNRSYVQEHGTLDNALATAQEANLQAHACKGYLPKEERELLLTVIRDNTHHQIEVEVYGERVLDLKSFLFEITSQRERGLVEYETHYSIDRFMPSQKACVIKKE